MVDLLPDIQGGANYLREAQPVTIFETNGTPVGSSAPATDILPVTPDDDTDLASLARALRIKPVSGAAGTIRITTAAGEVRDTEIDVGEILPVETIRVHDMGTTATGIEALI
jgi:hypothetical protein